MSASKVIHYFSNQLAAFGFWASLPPNNITVDPVYKRIDQSPPDIHTGICAAAHATLDTEQLIYHTGNTMVDAIASL